MIKLNEDLFLGEGTKRKCFAHPDNPDLCIKVSSDRGRRSAQREVRYLKLLHRRGKSLAQIADFKGTIQTNIGTGNLYEIVRDCDGQISKSIGHYLMLGDNEITSRIIMAIEDLRVYLARDLILFSDIRPENVLAKKECNGQLRLIIIDGIGDNNHIQFIEYIRPLGLRKCTKKWNAFISSISKTFPLVAKEIRPFVS